jgi:hypothetical protein
MRREEPKSSSGLWWQVAAGIVVGLLIFQAIERYQQRQALEAGLAAIQRAAKDPDPFGWQQTAARQREQQRRIDRAQSAKNALGPDERCINGQRFRRVENGYVQVLERC